MNKRRSLTESEIIKKEPIQNSEADEMNDWIYLFFLFQQRALNRMNEAEERIYDIEHKNFECFLSYIDMNHYNIVK